MSRGGPVDALLERWRQRATTLRFDAGVHPRGSYEDGERKGGARAIEGCLHELEDLVRTERDG